MRFKIQCTIALIIKVLIELVQYIVYLLIAPLVVFAKEWWDAFTSFPNRAIRFAWNKYLKMLKEGKFHD